MDALVVQLHRAQADQAARIAAKADLETQIESLTAELDDLRQQLTTVQATLEQTRQDDEKISSLNPL